MVQAIPAVFGAEQEAAPFWDFDAEDEAYEKADCKDDPLFWSVLIVEGFSFAQLCMGLPDMADDFILQNLLEIHFLQESLQYLLCPWSDFKFTLVIVDFLLHLLHFNFSIARQGIGPIFVHILPARFSLLGL